MAKVRGETGEAAESSLAVDAKADAGWFGLSVRGTGLWGGCVAGFGALACELTWMDHRNPQHFLLMCFTSALGGALFASGVMNGWLRDAIADKEYYRSETNRLAAGKAKLEAKVLTKRESSVPPKQR